MDSISIADAARKLGVSRTTLRRWDEDGRIRTIRTPGNHRRFPLGEIARIKNELDRSGPPQERVVIGYARVSSSDQKDDLKRQGDRILDFCAAHGWTVELITDLGSGLNYDKKGLRRLISRICSGEVERLVITNKDRLLRFGAELVFALCEQFGCEVVIINAKADTSFEEDLAGDVLEILTVFSARLYGARSHRNRKAIMALKEAAHGLAA